MAIMVGNGANAGALSPFAPTGIIVNGIMAKNQMPGLESAELSLQPRRARADGVRRLRALRRPALFARRPDRRRRRRDPEADDAFKRRQWITLGVIARAHRQRARVRRARRAGARSSPPSPRRRGAADDGEAIKLMPWRVIVMVCGVTVLIALVERFSGTRSDGLARRAACRRRTPSPASSRSSPESCRSTAAPLASCCRRFCRSCPASRPQLPGAERRRHRDVDEHRRPSRRRLAALDDRRALHRQRGGRATRASSSISCWRGACRWRSSVRCCATCCSEDAPRATLSSRRRALSPTAVAS